MTARAQPPQTRETREKVRSGRRQIPSGVLPTPSVTAYVPVKGIRTRPRRPVHTIRVSALFL